MSYHSFNWTQGKSGHYQPIVINLWRIKLDGSSYVLCSILFDIFWTIDRSPIKVVDYAEQSKSSDRQY